MPEISESKFLVTAGWDDVPHLDEKTKRELLASIPPFQRDARSKGTPSLGMGAIYPVPESEITVAPFAIPDFWPRGYALDPGWNRTAALWAAHDRAHDVVYFYTEHYRGQAEPSVHAAAIRARGEWIPGLIDPAANGRSQRDGEQLMADYIALGLKLGVAVNNVESGLYDLWERFSTGRLKVFSTCRNFLAEYRLYRRDEKGRVVKEFDHLMDCGRYRIAGGGLASMIVKPAGPRLVSAGPGDPSIGY